MHFLQKLYNKKPSNGGTFSAPIVREGRARKSKLHWTMLILIVPVFCLAKFPEKLFFIWNYWFKLESAVIITLLFFVLNPTLSWGHVKVWPCHKNERQLQQVHHRDPWIWILKMFHPFLQFLNYLILTFQWKYVD